MNDERTTRHRATQVQSADRRAAGTYEQCADAPLHESGARSTGGVESLGGLQIAGLVGRPGLFPLDELRFHSVQAHQENPSLRRIGIVDFFTLVRLSADAEIAMVLSSTARPMAFRVTSMLNDPSMFLEFDALPGGQSIDRTVPLTLFGSDIIGGSMTVSALDFVSFADFIGGRS